MGRIIHGDCLEVMKGMPDESIDLVVTSPPYNLRNTLGKRGADRNGKWRNSKLQTEGYNEHSFGTGMNPCSSETLQTEGHKDRKYTRKTHAFRGSLASKNPRKFERLMTGGGYDDGHTDDMPHAEYVKWQREVLAECMRLLKPTGGIFYNNKERQQNKLLVERTDILQGFPLRQKIIWKRKGGLNFNRTHFLPTYEIIYMITKPDFKLLPKANAMTDVWEISQEKSNPHPAPFPVEIPHQCISSCMTEGVVLDPFMGSGTTAIAAEKLGVDWMGIEKSSSYVEMAKERIEKERENEGGSAVFT